MAETRILTVEGLLRTPMTVNGRLTQAWAEFFAGLASLPETLEDMTRLIALLEDQASGDGVEGYSALGTKNVIPKVVSPGTLGPSAASEDGTSLNVNGRRIFIQVPDSCQGVRLAGRAADNLAYIEFCRNNGTTAEGSIYGGTDKLIITDHQYHDVLGILTDKAELYKKITKYNNIDTEGYGVPAIVDVVEDGPRNTNIGATAFTNANVAGLYEVAIYLETTTADAAAGQVTFTLSYTDSGGAITRTFNHALTTAATPDAIVWPVELAAGSISYAVALSVGAYGNAQYKLCAWCKRVK